MSCDVTKAQETTDVVPRDVSHPKFFFKRCQRFRDRIAVIDGATGETCTYSDLWRNVRRFAGGLHLSGFQKGDRFCIVAPNCFEYPVIYFGVTSLGGIVVPLNPLNTASELLYYFRNAKPSAVITSNDALETVLQASSQYGNHLDILVLGSAATGHVTYESVLCLGDSIFNDAEEGSIFCEWSEIDPMRDPLSLLYSSGTTGLPKACVHTHYNVISNVIQETYPGFLTFDDNGDVTVATVPMFHQYGVTLYLNLALYHGSTLVVMPRFQLETYLRLVENYRATVLVLAPPAVAMIAQSPLATERHLSSVRLVMSSAAPLRDKTIVDFRKKIPRTTVISQQYGMTESHTITQNSSVEGFSSGGAGKRLPFVQIKVVDPVTRRKLGPNEDGEICIKSPTIMRGYWKNPEATKAAFDEEGYMFTGDIGHYDSNEEFYIVDRIKDVMKYNGFQVNPSELESIILLHPRVKEVTVVGRPDELSGDLPTAFVVTRGSHPSVDDQGQDSALEKDIINFVNGKVAPWKRLRGGVRFTDSIPKSASGKVLRRQLRQLLIDEIEKERSLNSDIDNKDRNLYLSKL